MNGTLRRGENDGTTAKPSEGGHSLHRPRGKKEAPQSHRVTKTDHHVGMRVRERRVMMGLSQQQLAKLVGMTYQQAHKYERGLNRISAGRLFRIAEALNVPVMWFFEGLAERSDAHKLSPRQRLGLEMARNFALIEDEGQQEALSQMARPLVGQSQVEAPASGGYDDA